MNRKTNTHQIKHQPPQGQSLLEFILVLPMLLLLILGTMDFARLFTTKIVLTNAAREGANYLARNPSDFGGASAAIDFEAQNLTEVDKNISCSPLVDGACEVGGTASVKVTKDMDLIFSGFLQSMGVSSGTIELSSTVRMMVR